MCSCFNDFVWLSKYKKMLHASNIYWLLRLIKNNDIGCMYKQWFKNKVKHKQRAHYISVDLRINRYHFCTEKEHIHSLIKYVDIVNAELIESTLKQTIMCSCFNDFVWLSKYKKMLHASNIYWLLRLINVHIEWSVYSIIIFVYFWSIYIYNCLQR
jgi:hypothetical protein